LGGSDSAPGRGPAMEAIAREPRSVASDPQMLLARSSDAVHAESDSAPRDVNARVGWRILGAMQASRRAPETAECVAKRSSRSEPSGDRFGPVHPLTFAEVEQASDPRLAGKQPERSHRVRGSVFPEGAADAAGRVAEMVAPWLEKAQRGRAPSGGWCHAKARALRGVLRPQPKRASNAPSVGVERFGKHTVKHG